MKTMQKPAGLKYALLGLAAAATLAAAPAAQAKGPVIALSNAYYGNTWRHQMVEAFRAAATEARKKGEISKFIIVNGNGTVNEQMSQVSDLILRHVNVIAIDAASDTALNGIIAKACAAGIKVVAFDSIVSAPCAYKLDFDFKRYQAAQARWIVRKLHGKGNVIVVRGVKGSAPDHDMYTAQMGVLKQHPGIKVVATVYGQATGPVAQAAVSNVLPSLPHVDAVLDQGGGDDYGIAQAFEQYGGSYATHPPIIAGGGSANFIHWWAEQAKKTGYQTISMNTTPGIGGAAFWLSLDIAGGAKAPKFMTMPVATVTQKNLAQYADLKPGTIVSPSYSRAWVKTHLLSQTP
ncbi:ABC transporter substrate-binding protein [Acidiphilium sp.]|uniref:ABC transporter substrate-binding protein n=1 Tax=Acidiphilium sp. TaxID=527 RepID=UPI002589D9F3|nr:ABC transporter substrate-binding protein [Acidiphilium sp.]